MVKSNESCRREFGPRVYDSAVFLARSGVGLVILLTLRSLFTV